MTTPAYELPPGFDDVPAELWGDPLDPAANREIVDDAVDSLMARTDWDEARARFGEGPLSLSALAAIARPGELDPSVIERLRVNQPQVLAAYLASRERQLRLHD